MCQQVLELRGLGWLAEQWQGVESSQAGRAPADLRLWQWLRGRMFYGGL